MLANYSCAAILLTAAMLQAGLTRASDIELWATAEPPAPKPCSLLDNSARQVVRQLLRPGSSERVLDSPSPRPVDPGKLTQTLTALKRFMSDEPAIAAAPARVKSQVIHVSDSRRAGAVLRFGRPDGSAVARRTYLRIP